MNNFLSYCLEENKQEVWLTKETERNNLIKMSVRKTFDQKGMNSIGNKSNYNVEKIENWLDFKYVLPYLVS